MLLTRRERWLWH